MNDNENDPLIPVKAVAFMYCLLAAMVQTVEWIIMLID